MLRLAIVIGALTAGLTAADAEDWPQWRGPEGNNHAPTGSSPPTQWDLGRGTGVVWKTPIPGRGHSSPTIVGDSIYLTTADEQQQTQSLLVLSRGSGQLEESVVIHRGGLPPQIHPKNTHASSTVAVAGQRIFVVFYNSDAIYATALDLMTRRQLWQKKVCAFQPAAFQFGYGASPLVEDDLLIIAAEYDGPDSGLFALDCVTGRRIWKVDRPANLSFSSPVVADLASRRQLLLPGADKVQSFDPSTGRLLWSADASTEATCGTICWDHRQVFISGGNPVPGTWAVRADGSAQLTWQNSVMCYEQSLLADGGYLYAISDPGVAYCWKAEDGTEVWKKRLGGNYSASPLLAGDRIYTVSEAGDVHVFRASSSGYDEIATDRLGDEVFATPVALDDRLYVRYAVRTRDGRQEYVAALGH